MSLYGATIKYPRWDTVEHRHGQRRMSMVTSPSCCTTAEWKRTTSSWFILQYPICTNHVPCSTGSTHLFRTCMFDPDFSRAVPDVRAPSHPCVPGPNWLNNCLNSGLHDNYSCTCFTSHCIVVSLICREHHRLESVKRFILECIEAVTLRQHVNRALWNAGFEYS